MVRVAATTGPSVSRLTDETVSLFWLSWEAMIRHELCRLQCEHFKGVAQSPRFSANAVSISTSAPSSMP